MVGYLVSRMTVILNIVQSEIKHLFLLVIFGLLGWSGSKYFGLGELINDTGVYRNILNGLLSIGLYASVSGINLNILSESRKIVLLSVTVGVALKTIIIGLIYYTVIGNPIGFLYAIIVAQIDPLSVASMIGEKSSNFSIKAGTIIRGWSAFDDPITIVFAIYIASYFSEDSLNSGFLNIVINLGIGCSIFMLVYLFRETINKYKYVQIITLILVFINAIFFHGLLLSALVALVIRPIIIINWVCKIIPYILYLAVALIGMELIDGINWSLAFLLSIAVIFSQIIVGRLLTKGLSLNDRLKICFAQQNGLTAIILALVLSVQFPDLIAIIAPSVFIINLMHILLNGCVDIVLVHLEKQQHI